MVDRGMQLVRNEVVEVQEFQEAYNEYKVKKQKDAEKRTKNRRLTTTYKHTGFDFSQRAGQDRLITDRMQNAIRKALLKQL